MSYLRIAIIIITLIVSLSPQIHSQTTSTEPGTNDADPHRSDLNINLFETQFGSGLNCPPDIDNKYRACNGEAMKIIQDRKPTATKACSYIDELAKCSAAALETCKSQKARFVKEIAKKVIEQNFAAHVDCKTFTLKNETGSGSGSMDEPGQTDCSQIESLVACANVASTNVSSEVDYTARNTFAQHCRNRDDMIKCFNHATDTCKSPIAPDFKAVLVKSAKKAYKPYGCGGEPSFASASIIIVLGSVLFLQFFRRCAE